MNLSLEQTLASILQSLAEFFGVTTQTIMENAPMWLAKYGLYVTVKDLTSTLFIGVFAGLLLIGIVWFVLYIMMEADYSRWHLLLFILLFVLVVGVMVSVPLITCAIAPEYVGIEALLSLLQS